MNFEEAMAEVGIEEVLKRPLRTWLVVLPASGVARTVRGRLVAIHSDDYHMPVVFPASRQDPPMVIDPRAMIYDYQTLRIAWSPREHPLQKELSEWFSRNPDVFKPSTASGFQLLIGEEK